MTSQAHASPPQGIADTTTAQAELRRVLRVLRRRIPVLLGAAALITLLGTVVVGGGSSAYKSSAQVLLKRPGTNVRPETTSADAARVVQNEINFIRSGVLYDAVVKNLGYPAEVTVSAKDSADLVTITATNTDAERAAKIANTYATTYIDLRQINLQNQAATLRSQIDAIDAHFAQATARAEQVSQSEVSRLVANRQDFSEALRVIDVALAGLGDGPQVVTAAPVPTNPSGKTLPTRLLTFGMLGLVLGIAAALLADLIDRRVLDEDDLSRLIAAPSFDAVTRRTRRTADDDAHRMLRFRLCNDLEHRPGVVTITSADGGNASARTALRLAAECAQTGCKTLVIGADLRCSAVAKLLELTDAADGTTTVLAGESTLADAIRVIDSTKLVTALPAGPDTPGIVSLATPEGRALVASARELADLVLLEAPTIASVTDAVDLVALADSVVLVVPRGTRAHIVEKAASNLAMTGTPVLATLLVPAQPNRKRPSRDTQNRAPAPTVGKTARPSAPAAAPATTATPARATNGKTYTLKPAASPVGGVATRSLAAADDDVQ